MKRDEACRKFLAAHQEEKEALGSAFWDRVQERLDLLTGRIYEAFARIAGLAEEAGKRNCAYFLFSLTRYDLTIGRAVVRLDVLGPDWYLDEAPLTTTFDATFLFAEYFAWQKELQRDSRQYRGKVNRYDVSSMVQDSIMESSLKAAHILRFALRDIESREEFSRIGRLTCWTIRWGEYRDYSEIVLQVKRETRGQGVWNSRLKGYKDRPDILMADYWYRETLTEGDCRDKDMYFIVFEECTLKGITFHGAGLSGARFLRCRIEDCDFTGADLSRAEFWGCSLLGDDFTGAGMQQAVFSAEGFQPDLFDGTQLEELVVAVQADAGA